MKMQCLKTVIDEVASDAMIAKDDDQSTSAGGSDTEPESTNADSNDASAYLSDSDVETKDTDHIVQPSFKTASHKVDRKDVGIKGTVAVCCLERFARYIAKSFCCRRAPKAARQYDRSMLLQHRVPLEKNTKSARLLPSTMLLSCAKSSTPKPLCKPDVATAKISQSGIAPALPAAPPKNLKEVSEVSQQEFAKPKVFDAVSFRKELVGILRDLSSDRNVGLAVRRVRDQSVPRSDQAHQFVDILTRAAEEKKSATRRLQFAFVAGLVKARHSAFEMSECVAGLKIFFEEVYPELREEVPRLATHMAHELLPPLREVVPLGELRKLLPVELKR